VPSYRTKHSNSKVNWQLALEAGNCILWAHGANHRELVLQMLFQADMGKQTVDQCSARFGAEHAGRAGVRGFCRDLFSSGDRIRPGGNGTKLKFGA